MHVFLSWGVVKGMTYTCKYDEDHTSTLLWDRPSLPYLPPLLPLLPLLLLLVLPLSCSLIKSCLSFVPTVYGDVYHIHIYTSISEMIHHHGASLNKQQTAESLICYGTQQGLSLSTVLSKIR